jgi:hypothetical protein
VSVLIVVDSATVVVSRSVVIWLVRMVGGEEVIAEVVDIQQVLESAVVLEMGKSGLMYISLVVPVGGRDVPGGGNGEVGSGSGFILEMSLVVGWLLVVEGEVCSRVVRGSEIVRD